MADESRKRKRSETDFKENDNPSKKYKKIRQKFLEIDSNVTSLEFHPSTHTFAASCFNGKINLYTINQHRYTEFSHYITHPFGGRSIDETPSKSQTDFLEEEEDEDEDDDPLQKLMKENEAKLKRLQQLQQKNNLTLTNFDDEEDTENENEDDDNIDISNDNDDIDNQSVSSITSALSSISVSSNGDSIDSCSNSSIPCKHALFSLDGSILFGAWSDSCIAMYDYQTSKLIHHFNNNEFDTENEYENDDNSISSKLTAIKMYNHRTLVTGDADGIIRCWDIRMNLNKNNKSQRQYQYSSNQRRNKSSPSLVAILLLSFCDK